MRRIHTRPAQAACGFVGGEPMHPMHNYVRNEHYLESIGARWARKSLGI